MRLIYELLSAYSLQYGNRDIAVSQILLKSFIRHSAKCNVRYRQVSQKSRKTNRCTFLTVKTVRQMIVLRYEWPLKYGQNKKKSHILYRSAIYKDNALEK